jgi:phosphatidylglycerophosphatase A
MKRMLILVTLALFALCFIKGNSPSAAEDLDAVAELNLAVDDLLDQRVQTLALGVELSQAWTDL